MFRSQCSAELQKLNNLVDVGVQIIADNWSEIAYAETYLGESGTVSVSPGVLKHDTNAQDYTPTQSDLYDKEGNHLQTLPLHPLAADKRAIFQTLISDISEPDKERWFKINIPVINKNPFSKAKLFRSIGAVFVYFSRDTVVQVHNLVNLEYTETVIYIDGKEVLTAPVATYDIRLEISQGWHLLECVAAGGTSVSWSYLDLLRIRVLDEQSLRIVFTHPSCLVNAALAAVVSPYQGG